jgi:hypothetical protein
MTINDMFAEIQWYRDAADTILAPAVTTYDPV